MKLSLFSNDKTTCKDEIVLTIITSIVSIIGILLIMYRSVFGALENIIGVTGAIMMVFVAMMAVIIIYRFATNYHDNKDQDNDKQ